MLIKLGYELIFDIPAPRTPMVLMLYTHPEHAHLLQKPEVIHVEPDVPLDGYRCARIVAPQGKLRLTYDNVARVDGLPEPSIEGKILHPVEELPPEVMQFLLASRYCEVDRMTDQAWQLFGNTPPTWERVKAV